MGSVLRCALILGAAMMAGLDAKAQTPCPVEDLSCSKQTPTISDGVRRYINREMGLQAVFPAGSRVCRSRSGNDPRGFYAWYGTAETGCPERGDIAATFMGISSSYNALDYTSPQQAVAQTCGPPSPTTQALLRDAPLRIATRTSFVCETSEPDGATTTYVYAMAGKAPWNRRVPRTIYFAALGTRGAPQADDLAMFRTFLSKLRVGRY